MAKYDDLITEGQEFLYTSRFLELNEPAKLSAISYMRGLKDGERLANETKKSKEPNPAAV